MSASATPTAGLDLYCAMDIPIFRLNATEWKRTSLFHA